ncbi:hypothetical protein HK405_009088, partial [Cladochytrium tenue]
MASEPNYDLDTHADPEDVASPTVVGHRAGQDTTFRLDAPRSPSVAGDGWPSALVPSSDAVIGRELDLSPMPLPDETVFEGLRVTIPYSPEVIPDDDFSQATGPDFLADLSSGDDEGSAAGLATAETVFGACLDGDDSPLLLYRAEPAHQDKIDKVDIPFHNTTAPPTSTTCLPKATGTVATTITLGGPWSPASLGATSPSDLRSLDSFPSPAASRQPPTSPTTARTNTPDDQPPATAVAAAVQPPPAADPQQQRPASISSRSFGRRSRDSLVARPLSYTPKASATIALTRVSTTFSTAGTTSASTAADSLPAKPAAADPASLSSPPIDELTGFAYSAAAVSLTAVPTGVDSILSSSPGTFTSASGRLLESYRRGAHAHASSQPVPSKPRSPSPRGSSRPVSSASTPIPMLRSSLDDSSSAGSTALAPPFQSPPYSGAASGVTASVALAVLTDIASRTFVSASGAASRSRMNSLQSPSGPGPAPSAGPPVVLGGIASPRTALLWSFAVGSMTQSAPPSAGPSAPKAGALVPFADANRDGGNNAASADPTAEPFRHASLSYAHLPRRSHSVPAPALEHNSTATSSPAFPYRTLRDESATSTRKPPDDGALLRRRRKSDVPSMMALPLDAPISEEDVPSAPAFSATDPYASATAAAAAAAAVFPGMQASPSSSPGLGGRPLQSSSSSSSAVVSARATPVALRWDADDDDAGAGDDSTLRPARRRRRQVAPRARLPSQNSFATGALSPAGPSGDGAEGFDGDGLLGPRSPSPGLQEPDAGHPSPAVAALSGALALRPAPATWPLSSRRNRRASEPPLAALAPSATWPPSSDATAHDGGDAAPDAPPARRPGSNARAPSIPSPASSLTASPADSEPLAGVSSLAEAAAADTATGQASPLPPQPPAPSAAAPSPVADARRAKDLRVLFADLAEDEVLFE